jgi:hypothetical protein
MHQVDERKSIVQRMFQGYLVSDLHEFKPLGYEGDPFAVFELSFNAPRGLSGSPLMTTDLRISVSGIIIGNSKSSMLVFDTEEIEGSESEETRVQHYESMSLGVAVQSKEIFPLRPALLDCTISEYLERNGKLI